MPIPFLLYKYLAPTKDFLDELTERCKIYGWNGDYVEIIQFVESLYKEAQIDIPNLEPYEQHSRS